ncbi:hypothetical protein V6U90_31885 [Micromonospora sp. CPCC 206060]|uniref:hypothetical protein n=1 Tax=Micromonospora sp. CPCC 206060 TaxID=3122406 RepID=UPI002FEF5708
MPYLARRHLGDWERIGDPRGTGFIVVYLIAADPRLPAIAFNTGSRARGKGGAELSLPNAARLARRINDLLAQAGYELPDGDEDA